MLGRRNLRVKVMQALYAWEMDNSTPFAHLEGNLRTQIHRAVSLYLINLQYVVEVCNYSMVDKAKRMAKFIKTAEDEKASTTIAANRIVKYLQENEEFNTLTKKDGIRNYVNDDLVKKLFNELSAKQRYKEYSINTTTTLEQDKDIIIFLLKKVIHDSSDYHAYLEETFINFDDDNDLLLHIISKFTEAFEEDKRNYFQSIEIWEEEKKFAFDLLAKTTEHNEELVAIIQPNLKNWEMDRVAVLDLILMKMAVCELKYFPTVPVKVSINEYIDISKMYSTPKSKDFVNGVLDKVKKQLQDKGEIKKFGRGLME
jgi:N utilization substance protein B